MTLRDVATPLALHVLSVNGSKWRMRQDVLLRSSSFRTGFGVAEREVLPVFALEEKSFSLSRELLPEDGVARSCAEMVSVSNRREGRYHSRFANGLLLFCPLGAAMFMTPEFVIPPEMLVWFTDELSLVVVDEPW